MSFETFVRDPVGFEYFLHYASRNSNGSEYPCSFQRAPLTIAAFSLFVLLFFVRQ